MEMIWDTGVGDVNGNLVSRDEQYCQTSEYTE